MLPKSLKIGGSNYSVKVVKDLKHDGKGSWGLVSYLNKEISFERNFPNKTQELNTILHELIHCILDDRQEKQTEKLVESLGSGLTQLLRDNPNLVKHINELLK